jgi:hypothetical protein
MTIDDLEKEELIAQNLRLRRELNETQFKLSQITDAYDFVRSNLRNKLVRAVQNDIPSWEDPVGWQVVSLKDVVSVIKTEDGKYERQ